MRKEVLYCCFWFYSEVNFSTWFLSLFSFWHNFMQFLRIFSWSIVMHSVLFINETYSSVGVFSNNSNVNYMVECGQGCTNACICTRHIQPQYYYRISSWVFTELGIDEVHVIMARPDPLRYGSMQGGVKRSHGCAPWLLYQFCCLQTRWIQQQSVCCKAMILKHVERSVVVFVSITNSMFTLFEVSRVFLWNLSDFLTANNYGFQKSFTRSKNFIFRSCWLFTSKI